MNMVCLDLEGVLVPEIWIALSEESGIPELRRTTRDEPDYDKLMRWRLGILKEHGLKLSDVQNVIAKIDPLPGAKEFLDSLREVTQVVILSDTFEEFAKPLMKKLGWPTILCNNLVISAFCAPPLYRKRPEKAITLSSAKTVLSAISRCAARTQSLRPSVRFSPSATIQSRAATATMTLT